MRFLELFPANVPGFYDIFDPRFFNSLESKSIQIKSNVVKLDESEFCQATWDEKIQNYLQVNCSNFFKLKSTSGEPEIGVKIDDEYADGVKFEVLLKAFIYKAKVKKDDFKERFIKANQELLNSQLLNEIEVLLS